MVHPRFRIATPADVPAIVQLVTSAYRGDSGRKGWTTEADLIDGERIDPQLLHQDIGRPRSLVLLVDLPADAGLAACAHVAEVDGAGYFGMFAVRPDLQAGGLGRAVLAEAEQIAARQWRLPAMRMAVIDLREELIAWYQRRGYRRTGELQPFPYGDARFGVPRRDDLRFEMLEKSLLPPIGRS